MLNSFVYDSYTSFCSAAFNEVEQAAEASMEAERAAKAATTDEGSLVQQSQEVRAEVEEEYADKKREFDDKLQQV